MTNRLGSMMVIALLLAGGLAAGSAMAKEEVEISFRLRVDGSGNVRNQELNAEFDRRGGELEIRDFDQTRETPIDRASFDKLKAHVSQALEGLRLLAGEDIDPPYVEISFEYQGQDLEVEVSRRYPSGSVPKALVALQRDYFANPYE